MWTITRSSTPPFLDARSTHRLAAGGKGAVTAVRGLTLDGSGRERADDEPLQDHEGSDGGQHGQYPACRDHLGRGLGVVALEVEDADGDREQRGLAQEDV